MISINNIERRDKLKLNIDEFQLSSQIKNFLQQYQDNIWLVGGAARDRMLGREPDDYDFLVSDVNEKVLSQLLPEAKKVGKSFPVYLWQGVEFSWTQEQEPARELKRRDFTINSLAISLADGKILDFHNGLEDLNKGLIQPLPGALKSDPHRYYRCLRFLAQFPDFDLSTHCWQKLKTVKDREIEKIAVERVAEEFKKVLSAPAGERFFYALIELEGLRYHFTWLKENLLMSIKRWQTASCLTGREKLLFISLALNAGSAKELEAARNYLPLAQKWYRAAAIASEAVPIIRKWQDISCDQLAKVYESFAAGVLTPAEAIFIARVCDLSQFELKKPLVINYYQNLEKMWDKMSEEITGDALREKMKPGPEIGRELFRRRSKWLEKNRQYYR